MHSPHSQNGCLANKIKNHYDDYVDGFKSCKDDEEKKMIKIIKKTCSHIKNYEIEKKVKKKTNNKNIIWMVMTTT